jgi:uncharacterized membrane protein YhhN
MTTTAWWLIGLTLVVALCDWVAVGTATRWAEYVFKPLTMVPLILAAIALDPADEAMRWWFVAALVFSLAGDVFLMLPNEKLFVFGLGSFLIGHVAYIVGLIAGGQNAIACALGVVAVAICLSLLGPRIVAGARDADAQLAIPVLAYMTVISAMVAFAIGSTVPLAIGGAALFYVSDASIGWTRFINDFRGGRLVIVTTYHLAQVLLVLSLVAAR